MAIRDRPEAGARISDDAVSKATGRGWEEWFALLDAGGCTRKSHKEIVAFLDEQHGERPWWNQMITVGYERERGLRQVHEKPDGFEISKSKTLNVPASDVFTAWLDESLRTRWLSGSSLTVRKSTPNKTLRITWSDGPSDVEVQLIPKGTSKTQVTIQHGKLKTAADADRYKAFWLEALERLREVVETPS